MWGMCAENPGDLEIERIVIRRVAFLVLILEAEAQEFAPVPAHVRRDAPDLLMVGQGVLGPIEARAQIPVAVELLLRQQISAERVLCLGVGGVGLAVDGFADEDLVVESAGGICVNEREIKAKEIGVEVAGIVV